MICHACGMAVPDGPAYHPFATCLMFRASRDGNEVRVNLDGVLAHGAAAERARIRRELLTELAATADDRDTETSGDAVFRFSRALDRIAPEEP